MKQLTLSLFNLLVERILFIRGLGVQHSVINGFNQETTNFYPFELIKSFYIFESFDGLKVGHFFCIKLQTEEDNKSEYSGCVVLFEVMEIDTFYNYSLEYETSC